MYVDFEGTEVQPNQFKVGRRGTVSVKVTADELLAAAINVTQNQWPLEALGYDWMKPNAATRTMLEPVYEAALQANRLAVERRLRTRAR